MVILERGEEEEEEDGASVAASLSLLTRAAGPHTPPSPVAVRRAGLPRQSEGAL